MDGFDEIICEKCGMVFDGDQYINCPHCGHPDNEDRPEWEDD